MYLHKTKQIRIIIDDTLYRQADNNLQNFELICEVSFNCKSRLNDIQYWFKNKHYYMRYMSHSAVYTLNSHVIYTAYGTIRREREHKVHFHVNTPSIRFKARMNCTDQRFRRRNPLLFFVLFCHVKSCKSKVTPCIDFT